MAKKLPADLHSLVRMKQCSFCLYSWLLELRKFKCGKLEAATNVEHM
jgi:hypothetical protein